MWNVSRYFIAEVALMEIRFQILLVIFQGQKINFITAGGGIIPSGAVRVEVYTPGWQGWKTAVVIEAQNKFHYLIG